MKEYLRGIISTRTKSVFGILVLFLIFSVLPGISQENVKVQLTKSNFLFRNQENPATVSLPGTALKDIKVTIDNGTIVSGSNGYKFIPSKVGTAIVSVFVHDKLLKKEEFKVIGVVAKVNGHKSGDIEKSLLLTAGKINAEVEGAEISTKFKVVSFGVSAMIEGNEVSGSATSELLTTEQINLIKKLGPGDRVLISQIKVMGSDGSQMEVADLVLDLK